MTKNNDIIYGKVPPQAIEVEEAILGALMLEADAFSSIARLIDKHSFYKDEHQKIFSVIKDLAQKDKPVDLLIVVQELKNRNQLDEIGGPAFISQLTRKVASAAHIESHARILIEKYAQREAIRVSSEIQKLAYEGEDVEILENSLRSFVEKLSDIFSAGNEGSHIKQVLKETLVEIEADCTRVKEEKLAGIPTGFRSLDTLTGGWKPGNLVILAARPGVGKTSVALHFALQAARSGYWVNFFSLEMRKQDLARTLIAAESEIYRSNIRDGILTDNDWSTIHHKAIPALEKLPLIFSDINGLNISVLKSNVRRNRKAGKCDLAIVDYMQLVSPSSKGNIREQEISEISRTLKSISISENIPVIALSQLNRINETEEPTLINLRESGAIEQDADIVCFLHRPDPDSQPDVIRLSVAKHRRGRTDRRDIFSNKDRTRFSENPFFPMPHPIVKKIEVNPDKHIEPEMTPF